MSACSAAEIANKKRIALEKLRAKKVQPAQQSGAGRSQASSHSTAAPHTFPAIQPNSKMGTNKSLQPNAYRATTTTATSTKQTSASCFLNDLKQSSTFSHRKEAREMAHPYNRNATPKSIKPTGQTTTSSSPSSAPKQLARVFVKTPASTTSSASTSKPLASVFVKTVTCKVYLTSATRFAVQSSGYHAQLIEIFKKIPSKSYDNNTRIWSFGLNDYQLVQQHVSALKPDVVIGVIPSKVIKLCLTPQRQLDRSCLSSIEPILTNKLLPFQQQGVCFAIAQHGRLMICDEMGLGKTYQALAVADFYKEDWPLLICTTASTRESWCTHVRELLPSLPLHYIQMMINNQQNIDDAQVLISSYNLIEKYSIKIMERKFGFIIFDESHMLKNNKAKCTVVADRLARHAKHVVLLSGTPALSRPLELFSQLQMVDRKFMSFMDFTSRYCDGKQTNFGWDASGQSNLQELKVVLELKYMLRRTKADVLPELSEKSRETVILDPSLIWTNDSTKESLNKFTKNLNASKGKEKEEILLKFYAETATVKTRAVCAYLKTLLSDNIKFIVFAHHRVMINAISEFLMSKKVDFVKIDGGTRNELRAEYINTFQKKSSCLVALLSLKACNSGITLTAAEIIIFAELDWNPSTLAQAESRAHRIGQLKRVTCRYLMAQKTADDVIWNMLKSKQDVLQRAGLFCENLQEATHSIAPTTSKKIDQYFSPPKSLNATVSAANEKIVNDIVTNNNDSALASSESRPYPKDAFNNIDIEKELENIDELFADDDDFEDLMD